MSRALSTNECWLEQKIAAKDKAVDPIQYIGRGYLLCEGKLQELAMKHIRLM